MAKNDTSGDVPAADKLAEPSGAPELDPSVLDTKRRQEIDAAFSVEPDADVVAELPDETVSLEVLQSDTTSEPKAVEPAPSPPQPGVFKRFLGGYWARKKWTLPLTALVIIGILTVVPVTRYALLGIFVKNEVSLLVLDNTTHRPVISAMVKVGDSSAMTDTDGRAKLKTHVGQRQFTVTKQYYKTETFNLLVPVLRDDNEQDVKIQATGRQVPLSVVNKLTGKPVGEALLKAAGSSVKTDKDGKATIVLPADKAEQTVEVGAASFNTLQATLAVTEVTNPKNTFQITPSGKVYFLSKLSGKIDVVKTDLDGSDRRTVVAGTGREENGNTVLLASRDWKYLALLSRREEKPKLYLIDTTKDTMTVMDEGDATFNLIGWSGSTFTYYVYRNKLKDWEAGKYAVKSFNTATNKLATLDQSLAEGGQYDYKAQQFGNFYVVKDRIVYTTYWSAAYQTALSGKTIAVRSVMANGQGRKDHKTFAAEQHAFYASKLYAPDEVYFSLWNSASGGKAEIYEYEDQDVKLTNIDEDKFSEAEYATYLTSPDGKRTFWSEQRDGKDTFFTGNGDATEPKQAAILAEHSVYGWYSDDYLLVSKKGSELYILPTDGSRVTKVTDYHKPNISYRGYGGGYGGL